MCGIAAYFGPNPPDDRRWLGALAHRGPDGHGAWRTALPFGTWLQLVHTRLSILDLSDAGAQPIGLVAEAGTRSSEIGGRPNWRAAGPRELRELGERPTPDIEPPTSKFGNEAAFASVPPVVLSFNGEIYNYRELRGELAALGHAFRSSGDTEVLLRGYAEWGEGIFAKLDGMFALALFDAPRRRLVLARDHAGIKPLYHARAHDGGFLVASEVRAITGSGGWSGGIDREGVADFLQFGSLQEPRTIWDGVRAFPAGHWGYVRLDEGSPAALQLRPFWRAEELTVAVPEDEAAWVAEHDAILRATVAEQLASDVPLGVYLSGGIDSTLLTELAAEAGGRGRISAFTLAGAATENDEAELAAAAAQRAGVEHKVVHLDPGELAGWVRDGLSAMDQPSADGINTFLVSRASRRAGLVVALGGTGADELHGAYGHAASLARLQKLLGAVGPLRGGAVAAAVAAARLRGGTVAADRWRALCAEFPSAWRMACERRRFFTATQRTTLWPQGESVQPRWFPPFSGENAFLAQGFREQVRLTEVGGYLRNTLLRDADWATMGNQQELRVPFLGRRYMECVLRRPESATARRGDTKKPRLAALLTPESRRLAGLPKRGFNLNYTDLLLGPLRKEFGGAAESLRGRLGFNLEPATALGELERERSGKFSRRLWALLALGRYLGK